MRRRWQIAELGAALGRHWRVRPALLTREELASQLEVHPLEERRVLSASAALALAQALAASGIEQAEGAAKSPDPATPLGTDAAHQEPIDPGGREVPGQPAHSGGDSQDPKGPAAENLSESENRSASDPADVQVQLTADPAAQAAPAPLALEVADNQSVAEGTLLSITDIGTFTDSTIDSPIYTYSIDWGDGTAIESGIATIDVVGGDGFPTEGSFDGTHTYADNGTYTVTVTISSDQVGSASGQFTVAVQNVAPTLTVVPNQVTTEGTLLSITDIGTFTDPGFNNPLNVGGEVSESFFYSINWGDGTPVNSGGPTIDVVGGPGVLTQGSFNGSHTYADNGAYTVTVTINDDDGGSAVQTFTVFVNNVAPTLTVAPNQSVNEGALLSITNIGQITDPGFNNPLNVGGEVSENFIYAINWGDGTPVNVGAVTIDVPGGPGVPTQGSFDGSHIYADNGVYTVTVTVNDDDGGSVSHTFTVVVQNVAPVLTVAPDQVVNEGALLSITNIGQFTDPGFNNPNNVGGEVSETFFYSINWGDGTPVNTGPGTIDVPGGPGVPTQGSFDGSHIYADNGVYTVTVTVNDDDGGVSQQTFTVTVNNVAPTLVVPPGQVVNEGSLLSITNIGQFTDPGFNNPLNVGGEVSETFFYSINWGDGTPVNVGAGTIDVLGGPGVPTQGSFDGSHIYADNGVYTVTVTINDDDGGTAQQTFQVTVNNVAPTLVVPPDQVVNEGALLSIPNIGQFTDPGFNNPLNVGGEVSETFTYSIDWGDGTPSDSGPGTIDIPGGPGVPTQGSFDGSHIYADNGVYTVTVTISDDDGGVTQQTFNVTVNNVAPTLVVPPDQVVNEGALLSITNIGQFTDPGFNNPLNVGGEVSETFFYSINWGDGTPVNVGAGTIDIPGGPGVPTQGSFDGSHIYADNGVYTVTVTVNDDDGGVTQQTFNVTVNNVAPTLVVPPDQVVDEGDLLSLPNIGQYTDPGFDNPLNIGGELTERFTFSVDWGDGSPLDFGPAPIDIAGGPGVLTAGSFDGSHTYNASGTYTVTVTVNDDDGGTAVATFTVTVRSLAPILIAGPDQVTNEGAPLSVVNIGQFTDTRLGGSDFYTYSIDWGDGRPVDSGLATIDAGGVELPTLGSFDGAHTYADNGLYTVTVTITTSDGRTANATLDVLVNNVAPTLVVGPNQSIPLGTTLILPNVGQYNDPGFDNPLNVGGELTERFTFTINWGDGTPNTNGPATIDAPGAEGVLTVGSFDSQHLFASPGTFTVTVTVADDDGGTAVGTFEVTVFVLRPPPEALFLPPGGGGTQPSQPPPAGAADPRVVPPNTITRIEYRGARIASVAGQEPRLVLRIVTPAGMEDRARDETLPDEVLDNLRGLFNRLPDGHYRIYQIQPDGIERLVVDVLVHQGRSIELEPEAPPAEIPPQGAQLDTPATEAQPGEMPADEIELETDASAAVPLHQPEQEQRSTAALTLGIAGVALTSPLSRSRRRLKRAAIDVESRPMTKIQRILRRKR